MDRFRQKDYLFRLFRLLMAMLGMGVGYLIAKAVKFDELLLSESKAWMSVASLIITAVIFAIIFYIISPVIAKTTKSVSSTLEQELTNLPISDVIFGAIGLIFGLIIAYLISQPFYGLNIPYAGAIISGLLYVILGSTGMFLGRKKREDIISGITDMVRKQRTDKPKKGSGVPKILDTSVIIDGRIFDICKAGFMEGPLYAATFVLEELQHIADSADDLKRNRGRRGLDILKRMQQELDVDIIIYDKDKFDAIAEVDSKLLALTKKLGGKIVTNDYNLNKVADVQGVSVLNINELANAIKPVVLPGEEMTLTVVKEGKEMNQGLAYLDDGTMIVVENGRKYMNQTIQVFVTSVLQTAAGKMIFARPKQ